VARQPTSLVSLSSWMTRSLSARASGAAACGTRRQTPSGGQGRAGQGRAGQGRAGQGRAGQGRAGQGRAAWRSPGVRGLCDAGAQAGRRQGLASGGPTHPGGHGGHVGGDGRVAGHLRAQPAVAGGSGRGQLPACLPAAAVSAPASRAPAARRWAPGQAGPPIRQAGRHTPPPPSPPETGSCSAPRLPPLLPQRAHLERCLLLACHANAGGHARHGLHPLHLGERAARRGRRVL
jgi:hypothetical protein